MRASRRREVEFVGLRVRKPDEEFACPTCGTPIQVDVPEEELEPGEPDFARAFHDAELNRDFCSRGCVDRFVALDALDARDVQELSLGSVVRS